MWFSQTVLLLAACACLADEVLTEEMNQPLSASKLASPRSRRMVGGTLAPHVPWQVMVVPGNPWTAQAVASNEVAVEKVVLHPGFQNGSDWENDLALIQLKKPVLMSDKVTPIPLPERGQDLADTLGGTGVITGWGWGIHLTLATSLKYLVVPLANHAECKAEYDLTKRTPAVDDHMFCTGPTKYEENVCFGDAGGALAVTDAATGDIYAAGILSFDKSCQTNKYGVYMKISSYLPWIHSVIRGDTETSSALRSDAMSKMYRYSLQQ
ncbi:hypothetical protein CgunFtcFv8_020761 [Champsocephalus gunnari]|uniref:Peptidase S1 domain-containing protein n=2 Tax=Champsocephalus gunnari TaxID=52237 RepID=A0AAN8IEM5_CHAGU|nr:hypothetical protein CgunFtcFv8_020761 [Champsocephalus gunnari]